MDNLSATMSKADLHLHTVYSDGYSTPAELVDYVCDHTDLRVIAVTDHDAIDGAYEAQQYAQARNLDVIIGEEISTREGHMLAYFIERHIRTGMTARDTIAAIHDQGGLAVAAHPYDWMVRSLGRHHLLQNGQGNPPLWQFDAIETMNSSLFPQHANLHAAITARLLGLPITGGSDSHLLETVGYGVTLFAGHTADDLRAAIAQRQTTVMGRRWSYGELATAAGRLIAHTVGVVVSHFRK
jgi:predicted metal-dependent phosphoesterase TrpH